MLILQNRIQLKPVNPPPADPKPFAPGHYVSTLQGNDSQAAMNGFRGTNIRGFLKRYNWSDFETAEGVYDFTELKSDCDWALARNLTIIAMMIDKSFSNSGPRAPSALPGYLNTEVWTNSHGVAITGYAQPNNTGGYTGLRWKSRVISAFNAMINAMGSITNNVATNFDDHLGFHGIATVETSLGFTSPHTVVGRDNYNYDYTPELYKTSYQQILQNASNTLRRSKIFWYFNFFSENQSYMSVIAQWFSNAVNCPNLNIYAGGPDLAPEFASLNGAGDAWPQNVTMIGYGIKMFYQFSAPEYGSGTLASPHTTLSLASTYTIPGIKASVLSGGNLKITIDTPLAQAPTNPFAVGEVIHLISGVNTDDLTIGSIGGAAPNYTMTFTTAGAVAAATWVGGTAARWWTMQEYYDLAKGTNASGPTSNPSFPTHATLQLHFILWFPVSSSIYSFTADAKPLIAANQYINYP